MQRKFLTNLILLLFLNFLVKPFWILGIDRSVQNVVGSDYGFYWAIFNFSFLLNILLDLGITSFNNRNIAQNRQLLNKHFSGIIVLKSVLGLLYFAVTFSIALIIGYKGQQLYFLIFIAFNQFLISFILYLRSNISGLLMFRTDSIISVLDRLLMILICSFLLWGNITHAPFKIEWFIYAQTAAYSLTALTALVIVIRKSAFRKLSWNWPFFIMIIKQSYPFALLALLMSFYNRIDSVMIERLLPDPLGKEQATVYASAFRLLDASNMIAYLFAVLLLPIFSRMIKNGEKVIQMVRLSFSLLVTISVIVALGSFFYSYQIIDLLYWHHVDESAAVFSKLMFGFFAISTSYIFGTLLTANGNLKQLNIIAASSMLLSLALNFILIPRFYALGSAWASIITQFISAGLQVFMAFRIFKFKPDKLFISKVVFFVIGVIGLNLLSFLLPFDWKINFVLMLFAAISLSFIMKLLNLKSLKLIIFSRAD